MCPPDHYGIEYEINPWMSHSAAARSRAAPRSGGGGRDSAATSSGRRPGAAIDPLPGLPDLVFTANAGLDLSGAELLLFAISLKKCPQRQGELATTSGPRGRRFHGPSAWRRGITFEGGRRRAVLRRHALRRLSHPQRRRAGTIKLARPSAEVQVMPLDWSIRHYYHLDTCEDSAGDFFFGPESD